MLRKGFVFAMEEDGQDLAVVAEVPAVPETQTEVEDSVGEVVDTSETVEELVVASEEAAEDAETLGQIQEVMADSVEKGEGLDETSAQMAEVAVEALCNKLGIQRAQSTIPALESFGQKSSRVAATRVAMESIGDKIKQIWQAILGAVKKVWEMIKSFALSLVRHRGALTKHLESIKKKVDGLAGNASAKEKELSGSFAKAFSIGKKADHSTASKVMDCSDKLLNVLTVGANAANSTASKLLDPKGTKASLQGAGKDLLDNLEKPIRALGDANTKVEAKDGHLIGTFGNLVGGKSIVLSGNKKGDAETIQISLEVTEKEMADKAAALDRAQMQGLIKSALEMVKDLQKFDKIEKDLENVTKACNNVSSAIIGAVGKMAEDDKEKAEAYRALGDNVRSMNGVVAKFGASLPAAIFQAAKAAGDYVNASANNFGAKKEEAEKKE